MKDKRTDFRYFSRGERWALLFLIFFSCVGFLLPSAWLAQQEVGAVSEADQVWLDAQYKDWEEAQREKGRQLPARKRDGRGPLQHFDPNHVGVQQLLDMGTPPQLARNWRKYLEKGGKFKTVEGVKKLYGMQPGFYAKIRPWMFVATTRDSFPGPHRAIRRKSPGCLPLDINAADSLEWEGLPGIGPVLAGRIVRFRKRLGGFHSVQQVGETYGLPDSTFQRIFPCLGLVTPMVLLDINTAGEAELRSHPYVGYRLARMLVAFREQHGPFSVPSDLFNLPLMDTLTFERLKPYLRL